MKLFPKAASGPKLVSLEVSKCFPVCPQHQTFLFIVDGCVRCQPRSFDHLVGKRKQLIGHRQAEPFGGLEIDGEPVLRGRPHW
jgi:hypothetical protein